MAIFLARDCSRSFSAEIESSHTGLRNDRRQSARSGLNDPRPIPDIRPVCAGRLVLVQHLSYRGSTATSSANSGMSISKATRLTCWPPSKPSDVTAVTAGPNRSARLNPVRVASRDSFGIVNYRPKAIQIQTARERTSSAPPCKCADCGFAALRQ